MIETKIVSIFQHVKSKKHQDFVAKSSNYDDLDSMIESFNLNRFLDDLCGQPSQAQPEEKL